MNADRTERIASMPLTVLGTASATYGSIGLLTGNLETSGGRFPRGWSARLQGRSENGSHRSASAW